MSCQATQARPSEFWRRHRRSGIVLSYALPAAVTVRIAMRPSAPHSGVILAICAAVAVLTPLLLMVPLDRLVATRQVHRLFYAWELTGIVVVSVVMALDGGAESPYRALLFVLIAHAALAFPPVGTIGVGLGSVLAFAIVGLVGPSVGAADAVFLTAALVMTTAVAAIASQNYLSLNRRISEVAKEATSLAEHDGLTGCLNHRAFYERVSRAMLVSAPEAKLSVLVLDVDHFKAVNDEFGHPVGDQLLAELGAALRGACRAGDVAGRVGGDEFALLLVGADERAARLTADRLRARIADGLLPHGATVTIGAATAPAGTSELALIANADSALYATRRSERGSPAKDEVRSPARP